MNWILALAVIAFARAEAQPAAQVVPTITQGVGESGGGGQEPHLTVLDGGVTVEGALSADAIRRVVHEHFGLLRACYDLWFQRDPTLQGRITLQLGVDASGAVTSATDHGSTIASGGLRDCVTRQFKQLKFPPSASGGTVVYTVIFRHA